MTTDTLELVEANGMRFYLRPNTSDRVVFEDNILRHSYEKKGVQVKAGDNWLDIGGYIGTFSANIFANGGRAIVFEPDPENADLCEKNLELNGFPSAVYRFAVVHQALGQVPLYKNTHRGNLAANTLYPYWKKERPSTMVQTLPFFQAFEVAQRDLGHGPINVKFDCEGSEIQCLETMDLRLPIPQLTLEYHFSVDPSCERYWAIVRRLEAAGFVVSSSAKVPQTGPWPNPRMRTVQMYAVR